MKKLSILLSLTACTGLFNCSPEDTETTENSIETVAEQTVSPEVEEEPLPLPTPVTFKKYDLKTIYDEIVKLKEDYGKAHKQGHGTGAYALRDSISKKQEAMRDKYSSDPLIIHPLNPFTDCWYVIANFDAANSKSRMDVNGEDDETWARITNENYADYEKKLNACKTASETGISQLAQDSVNDPEYDLWTCKTVNNEVKCSAQRK